MSEASPRFFSTAFKVDLVARLERGEAAATVAREAGVARKLLNDWLKAYRAHGPAGLKQARAEGRVAAAASGASPAVRACVRGRRPVRPGKRGRTRQGQGAHRRA
jgi:transposase-like protein